MSTETVILPDYLDRAGCQTEITVWPISTADNAPKDRLCIAVYSGAVSMHLRPTAAEARELITALERALEGTAEVLS